MENTELQQNYWHKRFRIPRGVCLLVNAMNLFMQARAVLSPLSKAQLVLDTCFTVNSIIIFALILPSFLNREYIKYVRFGFMLFALKQIIWVFDLSGQREEHDFKRWALLCIIQLTGSNFCIFYHFHYFNNKERGHLAFSIVYLILLLIGIMASVYGI